MDYKYYYEMFKKNTDNDISKEQFNEVVNFVDSREKLAHTWKFYHMVYSFYQDLEKEGKLKKQLIAECIDEFRVSDVTIFGILKGFRDN